MALLFGLSFRGWSVLLLAPAAALVVAAFSGEPLLVHLTQTFMGGVARFVGQFFPIFLLGAVLDKLMEDSGSVAAVSDGAVRTPHLRPHRMNLDGIVGQCDPFVDPCNNAA